MDSDTELAITLLADAVSEGEDGGWSYSGSDATSRLRQLKPYVVDGLGLSPEDFRINSRLLESELNHLILEASKSGVPAPEYVEENLQDFKQSIYDRELRNYVIAFPLNFRSLKSDLLPDTPRIKDIEFETVPRHEWEQEYLPNFDGNIGHKEAKLERFLERSPNTLPAVHQMHFRASYQARDPLYAVRRVGECLNIFLGMVNYSMTFGRVQTMSANQGPWPNRWQQLRSPFIFLLFEDGEFEGHYWGSDASPRDAEKPNSMFEESFEYILDRFPSFEDEYPLDSKIWGAIYAFQEGITNPDDRESFFDYWRVIELLTLVGQNHSMRHVIERATGLIQWRNHELGEFRARKLVERRNTFVHENNVDIRDSDRNLAKTLLEVLIDHYIERRQEWDLEDMEFVLDNATTNEDKVDQLIGIREREIQLLEWMRGIEPIG